MDLSGKVVVVTGSSGYLGRALVAALEGAGAVVRGVCRTPRAGEPSVDVTDRAAVDAAFAAGPAPDYVVHTAAVLGQRASLARCHDVHVNGTGHVLRAAVDAGARRFVHVSSIAVLGFRYPEGASEDVPITRTGNAYADTKAAAETIVRDVTAGTGTEAVIVRPGDLWGPGSPHWVEAPLQAMRAGRFVWISGGRGNLDLVHIEDLVAGVLLALTHAGAAGRTLHLTDGARGTSARDYFTRLAAAAGVPLRARSVPALAARAMAGALAFGARLSGRGPARAPDAVRFVDRRGWVSCAAAREAIGYAPRISLERGMRALAEGGSA